MTTKLKHDEDIKSIAVIGNYLPRRCGIASQFLNISGADIVCLQHEFGIFGWAVKHEEISDDPDGMDAGKIYHLLENEIIPLYYNMSENSIPVEWVKLMKESIKSNAARFSARRMVREYVEKFYFQSIQKDANLHLEKNYEKKRF